MLENVCYLSNESLNCSLDDVDVGSNLFEHYSPLKVLEDQAELSRAYKTRKVAAITELHL
jgi:hypothetical protein